MKPNPLSLRRSTFPTCGPSPPLGLLVGHHGGFLVGRRNVILFRYHYLHHERTCSC